MIQRRKCKIPRHRRSLQLPLRCAIVGSFLLCPIASTTSSGTGTATGTSTFPGTLKDWWQPSESESSSDWDWVEDPEEELMALVLDQPNGSTLSSTIASTVTGNSNGNGSGNGTAESVSANANANASATKVPSKGTSTSVPDPAENSTRTGSMRAQLKAVDGNTSTSLSSINPEQITETLHNNHQHPLNNLTHSTPDSSNVETTLQSRLRTPSNKPLQTLEKLQQMLEDTDYLTTSRRARQDEELLDEYDTEDTSPNPLWTSKDRSKYKRQQRTARTTIAPGATLPSLPHLQPSSTKSISPPDTPSWSTLPLPPPPPRPQPSTVEAAITSDTEDPSDTDDGLGYTLPNLPVYLSDDEGDITDLATTGNEVEFATASRDDYASTSPQQPTLPTVTNQNIPPPGILYPNYPYPNTPQMPFNYYPPPPPPPLPHLPHPSSQQYYVHPAYTGWGPHGYYYPRPSLPRVETTRRLRHANTPEVHPQQPHQTTDATIALPIPPYSMESKPPNDEHSPNFRWTLDSITKLTTCVALAAAVCYSAVSPHSLPFLDYNQKFYEALRLASLTLIVPLVVSLLVIEPSQNQLSPLINGFYHAFTLGYALTFVLEIMAATVIRLAVFCWWEPNVFQMTPQVPLIVAPWVLREQKVLVKPITLIVQDLVTSTIVCPLMEEWIKLLLLQWTIPLEKNFQWVTKPSKSNPKRRKWVAEPLESTPVVNINSYVSGMLAVSIGLKLADAIRRVCMYTKVNDQHKGFYAFCRGLFPIPELCGTVTALGLARRDVLGQRMPQWQLLLPAAVIHGMANFRGMKPIFKWNSSTPWTEMQLSTNFLTSGFTLAQLASKAFPKVMWLIIMFRVTGYCIKNYYLINRQAVKRTTTYAGKHAAFSAELAAAEMLKKTQKEK